MTSEIRFRVDGTEVRAPARTVLMEVLGRMGISVPTLCHHPAVASYGACRLCLVEIKKGKKSRCVTACNFPASADIEVSTNSERVRKARRLMLELLLPVAPNDPTLTALAREYSANPLRFAARPDPSQCVLCGLCIRVCREVVKANVLTFMGRGVHRTVGTPFERLPDACIGCGACARVCPTGVIDITLKKLERLRQKEGPDRLCRYSLMGLLPSALCARSYECENCEVEHRYTTLLDAHPVMLASDQEMTETQQYLERQWRAKQ